MGTLRGRRLELTCTICSEPLTSTKTALTEQVLAMIAEQNVLRKTLNDHAEYTRYVDIDKDQVVATKCGHMFHMGCLRSHVKNALDKKGTVFCPICTKPVTLTRVWPVLIPPTPCQAARFKKMSSMKEQNTHLQADLQELRKNINKREKELKDLQDETVKCFEDIQDKQKQLDALCGPSEEELAELRKIHSKRQTVVKVVTKHNAELLEVLMHETNFQLSDVEDENGNIDNTYEELIRKSTVNICPPRPHRFNNSVQSFDNRYAKSTAYGMPTDSFQEMNDNSSVTFSEQTVVAKSNSKEVRRWEAAKDIFSHVKETRRRGPTQKGIEHSVPQESFCISLGRRDGTRGICKKDGQSGHPNGRKRSKKKPSRPEWRTYLNDN